jgi:hypothetical protein
MDLQVELRVVLGGGARIGGPVPAGGSAGMMQVGATPNAADKRA